MTVGLTVYLWLIIAAFVGVAIWAFGRKRKARFEPDAKKAGKPFFLRQRRGEAHVAGRRHVAAPRREEHVGQIIGTFREFPPSQKGGTFTLDAALEALQTPGKND